MIYLRARYYDPSTGQFLSRDPVVDQTRQPYSYVGDNPLNRTDDLGLCWPSWACGVENALGGAKDAVTHWATTPQRLPNPGFITGPINVDYGAYKVMVGVPLIIGGSGADITIIGGLIGVPAQLYGGYQVLTGCARTYRGWKQWNQAVNDPWVEKSPLQYGADLGLNLAPGGGAAENFLGGLP